MDCNFLRRNSYAVPMNSFVERTAIFYDGIRTPYHDRPMNSFVERTAIFYVGIRTPYHDRLMNANVVFNNNSNNNSNNNIMMTVDHEHD